MAFRGDLGTFFSMATPIFGALEHWTGLKAFLDRSLGFNRLAFHHLDATLWHKLVVFPVPFVCFFSRFLSFFSIFGFGALEHCLLGEILDQSLEFNRLTFH